MILGIAEIGVEKVELFFNAANVVPTGGDNRPTNAYVNYIIKT